jgi:hypothetical protein
VLVAGEQVETNPQTTPRVTVTGMAEVVDDAALKARYLAVHPYASLYADFGDFALWRIHPANGLYVGGFGRAARLAAADLSPDPLAVAAIDAAASQIIAHSNADHAAALARIAGRPGDWQMVSVDVDGCDLGCGEQVVRVHWTMPVTDTDQIRSELAGLARAAGAG